MSQTAVQEPARARGPLNGVDTPNLFATINAAVFDVLTNGVPVELAINVG